MKLISRRRKAMYLPLVVLTAASLATACSETNSNAIASTTTIVNELAFRDDDDQPVVETTMGEHSHVGDEHSGAATDSPDVTTFVEERVPGDVPTVSVVTPSDGAVVPQIFDVEIEVDHFDLSPIGRSEAGAGHWHIIIDEGCRSAGEAVPHGDNFVHVGDDATSKTISLTPGKHELCIQLGDGFHVAVAITDTITVFVE